MEFFYAQISCVAGVISVSCYVTNSNSRHLFVSYCMILQSAMQTSPWNNLCYSCLFSQHGYNSSQACAIHCSSQACAIYSASQACAIHSTSRMRNRCSRIICTHNVFIHHHSSSRTNHILACCIPSSYQRPIGMERAILYTKLIDGNGE